MNSKKFLAFTMAAAMTLSLAACGGNGGGAGSSGGSSASGSTGDTSTGGVTAGTTVKEVVDPTGAAFKIGATGPLTGDASIYGLAAYRGAQIAVNEINSEGGDIQFELNYQDDQNVPETAVNAFRLRHHPARHRHLPVQLRGPDLRPDPLRLLPRRHRQQGQRVPDVLLRPQPGPGLRSVYL